MKNIIYQFVGGKASIDSIESFIESINYFSEEHSLLIQVFNAEMICGKRHLQSAVEHAIRALNQQRMSTQSIQMEVLLYASGERQLKHAIPKMGVKQGRGLIAILFLRASGTKQSLRNDINLFLKTFQIKRDDSVLDVSERKIQNWGFSKKEMTTINTDSYEDLILEKIAIVDIIK